MNVKILAELRLMFAASLASVIVASPCVAALCSPVGAVVREFPSIPEGVIWTDVMNAHPVAKAFLRTKAATGAIIFRDFFAALFASALLYQYDANLTGNVVFSGALAGTVDARPTRVIPEFFTAFRAVGNDALGGHLASTGTVGAIVL